MAVCCVPIVPSLWTTTYELGCEQAWKGFTLYVPCNQPSLIFNIFKDDILLYINCAKYVDYCLWSLKVLFKLFWRCVSGARLALFLHKWFKCCEYICFSTLGTCTLIRGGEGPRRSSPERHKITGQIRCTKDTITKRVNVSYIPTLHWVGELRRKTHKKSPRPGATHIGQYNMILVVQTVQQLHHAMNHHSPHKRVVIPEHVTYPDKNKKNLETKTWLPTYQHNPVCQSVRECWCNLYFRRLEAVPHPWWPSWTNGTDPNTINTRPHGLNSKVITPRRHTTKFTVSLCSVSKHHGNTPLRHIEHLQGEI